MRPSGVWIRIFFCFALWPLVFNTGIAAETASSAAAKKDWFTPTPPYPESARQKGVTGECVLRVAMNASGAVVSARIVKSSGDKTLDRTIAAYAREHWRGPPEKTANVPVTFRLQGTKRTPLETYHTQIQDAIGQAWYVRMVATRNTLPSGVIRVSFAIESTGKVTHLQLITPPSVHPELARLSLEAIRAAKIPPIPAELTRTLEGGRIEFAKFQFAKM